MGSNALLLRYSTQSDVGKKRAHNEDDFCALPTENFFAVADGMGGHAGGGEASRIAIETITSVISQNRAVLSECDAQYSELEKSPVAKLISDALRNACHAIYKQAQLDSSLRGMGTTTTCLLINDDKVFIGHVGDSRAYLLRDGKILQLSEDHSLINEQLKAGLITNEQAKHSRFRNIITRSIGFEKDVDVDMIALKAHANDVFLLCTDGLTGLVSDDEIHAVISKNNIEDAAQILIDLANKKGGDDNITVILIQVSLNK